MKIKWLRSALIAAGMLASSQALATTIDFSPLVAPGSASFLSSFTASGFQFQSNTELQPGPDSSAIISATESSLQHPTTGDLWAVLLAPNGGGSFSQIGGGTFTLNSIDISWFDQLFTSEPHSWTLTGTFHGGGTVTVSGVLQPGTFVAEDVDWSDLVSVSFTGNAPDGGWMGVNNIVVDAVPEPSTWAMLLIGFATIGFASFRKIRNPNRLTTRLKWYALSK